MRKAGASDIGALRRRSVADIRSFWNSVVDDLDITFSTPYEEVLDVNQGPAWPQWFKGGAVNVAEQCVDRWAMTTPSATAVICESEDGETRSTTYAELRTLTDRFATSLVGLGVGQGDRVAIYMPMSLESVVAVMSCAKIGAVWVPVFSGFGSDAVAARLADAGCTILVTADVALRKGTTVGMKAIADRASELAGGVRHQIVWHRRSDGEARMKAPRDIPWDEMVSNHTPARASLPLDPEHPLFIAHTSGTTGKPKGVVHVHGGFLVKVSEEVAYQIDLHPDEVLHWVTDLGWIMGPWEIIGALALGSSVLIAEGSPMFPSSGRLWEMVERHGVTTLGVSPTLVRALMRAGGEPSRGHDLSSLRILASTGEVWDPSSYEWLSDRVGHGRLPIINLSGGTEVGACFLSPHPVERIKACSLGGPSLGMDVAVFDQNGQQTPPGVVGELVCRQPWPSMTRGLWQDPSRYVESYWSRFPDTWTHGDWASVDVDGAWFLHGRSDDTLTIAGKRLGPGEVEAVLCSHPSVTEAAAFGVPDELKGEMLACLVVLTDTRSGSDETLEELREFIASRLGRSFLPKTLVAVDALPKTRSGKIVRRVLRAVATGDDPGDLSGLEDQAVLESVAAVLGHPSPRDL